MRHWAVAFALGWAGAAQADEPSPPMAPPEREGPADCILPPCPASCGPNWTVDFIFGLPTGFRFQRAVNEERLWHFEGFVGLEMIFPMAGIGVRRRYAPLCGQHNALIVAPGIDGYALYNPFYNSNGFLLSGGVPVAGIAAADVDILWRHTFTERCESQLGFKIGAGAGYGASWGVIPIAGVFTGLRW